MKILLTTDTWVPTINGVVTSTATLRAALTAQGHEVRVLTLSGDSHTYTKDGVTSLGSLDAGLVYPGARMRAPALNRAIRDLIDWHPDVVHSQCEFSTFAPARRIAHAAGAPLIHTYHTVYEDYTHYFSPSRSMGRKMAALFTRMICADCDAVIAPTPKISRLLAGYGVHCPVRIIPTGLDLQRFAVPRDDALRSRLGLPPKEANKTVLLSLGRLAKEKNTTELVDSMQNLPDAVLLIVGDGPERAVLEQQAQSLGVADRVIFVGAVPPAEVPRYYALGDVFVSASTSEAQGLTYIEAMAAGNGLEKGKVKLGAFNSVCAGLLPQILKSFMASYPQIEVEVYQGTYDDVKEWLRTGQVDLAFLSASCREEFNLTELFREPLLCIVPQDWPEPPNGIMTPELMNGQSFVVQCDATDAEMRQFLKKYSISTERRCHVIDDQSNIAMVEAGLGISIMPRMLLRSCTAAVKIYPIEPEEYRVVGLAVQRPTAMAPAVEQMFHHIVDFCRQMDPQLL